MAWALFVGDRTGAALIGIAALLWITAGPMLRASAERGRFTLFWLLTLTGRLDVFVAANLITFYLAYGLVSLAAFGLIAHDGTAFARRATGLYLLLAILGEIALLLAFALLSAAASKAGFGIEMLVAARHASAWHGITMALLLIGFALISRLDAVDAAFSGPARRQHPSQCHARCRHPATAAWWAMALAALVLPWSLLPALGLGTWQASFVDALTPAELWKALWPRLLGAVAGAMAAAGAAVEGWTPSCGSGRRPVLHCC